MRAARSMRTRAIFWASRRTSLLRPSVDADDGNCCEMIGAFDATANRRASAPHDAGGEDLVVDALSQLGGDLFFADCCEEVCADDMRNRDVGCLIFDQGVEGGDVNGRGG